ncbi:MAG: amino acid adenylation domain-containing protein, partial [Pyrinomonadaceae bacterium]
ALSYSTDLFERATAERMARHWRRALEAFAVEPDRRLHEVELLADGERRLLLRDWNATGVEWDSDSLTGLFEVQAARTPHAVAVEFEGGQFSYAELNARANRLAHHLRSLGVAPDSRVGVCAERGPEMVTAVLGVLKAGGAYVPLDPAYPAERLSFMLEDAQCAVLLSTEGVAPRLPPTGARLVLLDAEWHAIERESAENPAPTASPDNLAYVIYTSGSTGRPKGVAMTRRVLHNVVRWQQTSLPTPARTLQFASLSFDVSFQEMLTTWCAGGALLLVDEGLRRDPDAMLRFITERQVERLFAPFVYLQHLAEAYAAGGPTPASLRELVTAGEQLEVTPQIARLCRDARCRLHNHYGPSETHVVTSHELRGEVESWPALPPIGRPVANTQVYVLDAGLRPTPVRVAGEMYLGGEHVSRGYLSRPGLTAERFIPDPFSPEPGARLYRTGDLARYLDGGEIEFLGRADTQVKVRGFRVELGEVEAALSKHPQVIHAVVAARGEGAGGRRLVAYVVAAEGWNASGGELQRWTRERLPDYMTPSAWVFLDKVPLTPSGKIDRRALPDPGRAGADDDHSYAAPRTPAEEVLAAVWGHVLGLERVGRHDDFFLLGGHSLLATRVASRVRDAFRVELPVRAVFETPTLKALAARVESLMRAGSDADADGPPLARLEGAAEAPLSYAQQRLWFLDQLSPNSNAYNLPAAMLLDDGVNAAALTQALSEVARRHEALRTTFASVEGEPRQLINPPASLKVRLADLRRLGEALREAEAERLRADDALRPFDLAAGPLLRVTLARLDGGRYLLLACMHHIVSDGWSMGVLMQEVESLYEAYAAGRPSPLEELPVQYADYARWQRERLQGETLRREVEYWRAQLDGAPTLLELETDHPRPTLRTPRGAQHAVSFSPELSRALREFSWREGATPFMAYMAAFHALLHRATGQEEILVGTPVAGRGRSELEPLVGFFVNMIPVRGSFDGGTSFRTLLGQVREATLAAQAHGELPFDRLVEELQPERAPGRNPVFQVVLAFQPAETLNLSMAGVSAPSGPPLSSDAKFDLEVYLWDTPAGVTGALTYSPELFEPETVARIATRFERMVARALAEPDAPLSRLPLTDEAERRRLVEEWNDTAVPFPSDSCLHEVFERQASETPDAVAVEFEGEQLSYRGLNRRADELARRLRRAGADAESFVGVMLERSAE